MQYPSGSDCSFCGVPAFHQCVYQSLGHAVQEAARAAGRETGFCFESRTTRKSHQTGILETARAAWHSDLRNAANQGKLEVLLVSLFVAEAGTDHLVLVARGALPTQILASSGDRHHLDPLDTKLAAARAMEGQTTQRDPLPRFREGGLPHLKARGGGRGVHTSSNPFQLATMCCCDSSCQQVVIAPGTRCHPLRLGQGFVLGTPQSLGEQEALGTPMQVSLLALPEHAPPGEGQR
mmetsp:Transcript_35743/g.70846  ORF Transcript_35743/g.70846 Transcript_35743/m.70846 type:complete len:236 (-) Transcript_35743:333-1040(-)